MSPSKAILAGAILITTGLVFVNTLRPAVAANNGPFQLMHHSNTTANVGVFRLDVNTGDVSYCYLPNGAADLVCTKPTR